MGLLSLLFGDRAPEKVEVLPDHIWMTNDAKFNGIRSRIQERDTTDSAAILLVAQFPDVLEKLRAIGEECEVRSPVLAVLASHLTDDFGSRLTLDESAVVDIIVAERHPLRTYDDDLLRLAHELPCRSRLVHHLSLDDAVMKPFASEWVHDLLSRLGMNEDEVIESPLVTRQIQKAQRRIEERHQSDEQTMSATEWMEKNCPSENLEETSMDEFSEDE